MKIRRIIACASATLSIAVLGACASGGADAGAGEVSFDALYPSYATGAELVKEADLVIRGVAIKSRVDRMLPERSTGDDPVTNPQAGLSEKEVQQWQEDAAIVVTVSTVRIEEVVKGDATVGDTVEVNQMGGTLDGVRYTEKHTTMLSAGSGDYLLFLRDYGNDKPRGLLNPDQAVYTVNSDGSLLPVSGAETKLDIKNIRSVKSMAAAK